MAYADHEWAIVRAFYESGLSLGEITKRAEVVIKDRGSISRKASKEGWIKAENATLIEQEVNTKQAIAAIAEQKATLNATALEVHNILVDEQTKHVQFFTDATVVNIKGMVDKLGKDTSIMEHRIAQAAIKDGRETVLGKSPDVAVQVNNNSAPPQIIIEGA